MPGRNLCIAVGSAPAWQIFAAKNKRRQQYLWLREWRCDFCRNVQSCQGTGNWGGETVSSLRASILSFCSDQWSGAPVHMLTMHLAPRIEFSRLYLKQALDFTLLSTRYSATIWSPHFMKRIFGIFWYIAIYKYPNIEIFKIACPLFAPDQTTCSACNICKLGTSAIVGAFDCSNKNNPVQADFNTQIEICTFFWKLL